MLCLFVVSKKSPRKIRNIFLHFFLANLYTCVDSWPGTKFLPSQLGEIGGLALNNANDELVLFHRDGRKWEKK